MSDPRRIRRRLTHDCWAQDHDQCAGGIRVLGEAGRDFRCQCRCHTDPTTNKEH